MCRVNVPQQVEVISQCPKKEEKEERPMCCATLRKRGIRGFFSKYFCEGQIHNKAQEEAIRTLSENLPVQKRIMIKYRRLIGFIIPAIIVHFLWWSVFIKKNLWYLFLTKFPMSITMVFGSLIAGMTSEGGGAVAFPVMTLVLSVKPEVARDFSMMIQACGMTCAALSIFFMRIQLEWSSIIFCSIGGIFGMIFGFEVVDPALSAPQKKMFFVSIWFAFAFALFLLNRHHKRKTFRQIQNLCIWKVFCLLITGFVGGIFTSFAGSGLDICSFSILTLFFRVTEKVATPTSVVLMAGASIFGIFWRCMVMDNPPEVIVYEYVAVCIPIVVIGAPCGAVLGSHFHRLVLAALVYILDTVALVAAFVLIPQTALLAGVSVAIILTGFLFFIGLTYAGQKLLQSSSKEKDIKVLRRASVPELSLEEQEQKEREFKKSIRPALRRGTVAFMNEVGTDKENNPPMARAPLGLEEETLKRLRKMAPIDTKINFDSIEEDKNSVYSLDNEDENDHIHKNIGATNLAFEDSEDTCVRL